MLKIGLTGGIGCGKSSAVACFRELGIPIIDADHIAREVVEPGQPALGQIVTVFGDSIVQADGSLNRSALRQQVFSDPKALRQLEAIIHPVVRDTIGTRIVDVQRAERAPYVVVDVPLLFEKAYQSLFDRVIVVDCLPEQQIARVSQRDASSEETIKGIMATQMSRAKRLRCADNVLENTTTMAALERQVIELHAKFSAMIIT